MNRARIIGLLVLSAGLANVVFGQFPQMERQKQRMDTLIRADEERQHDRRLEESSTLPVPKKAVMNVDVQIALTKAEYKTFAEAKAAEVKKVVDGEPLWLYIKFRSKLGDYVLTTRNPQDPEKLRYTLFAEFAPRGDITALRQFTIQFGKEDLPATELKIGLAPGLFGRNKSIPVFLMTTGSAKKGVWNNELRLTNTIAMPRALTDNLASAPVTLDLSTGTAKYQKMDSEYDSIILRGSTDLTRLPAPGTFFSEDLKARIATQMAAENIKPVKIYFSGDDWQEYSSFGMTMTRIKRVFATVTYREEGDKCFYGVAEIVQNFDFVQSKFTDPEIRLQKNLPAKCEEIN